MHWQRLPQFSTAFLLIFYRHIRHLRLLNCISFLIKFSIKSQTRTRLTGNKLYRKWRRTLRTYIPKSKMRLRWKPNYQTARREVNDHNTSLLTTAGLLPVYTNRPIDKTTLRIGYVQFFVRTDHYALVLSPWATRQPTGHGLVRGGMPPSVSATGLSPEPSWGSLSAIPQSLLLVRREPPPKKVNPAIGPALFLQLALVHWWFDRILKPVSSWPVRRFHTYGYLLSWRASPRPPIAAELYATRWWLRHINNLRCRAVT